VKHKQILDKLASRELVVSMNADLARSTREMMLTGGGPRADQQRRVLAPVLARWRCLLDSGSTPAHVKDIARVALATLLHKYGFAEQDVTASALTAVDDLNRGVVLSGAFGRQAAEIKALLCSPPVPRTRRPPRTRAMTFLRPGDVVSIQLDQWFQAAYVIELHSDNGGTFPVIEFYQGRFYRVPAAADLSGRAMARDHGRARFGVDGLTYLPDPAGQVVQVAAGKLAPPQGTSPGLGEGSWIFSDILLLQEQMARLLSRRSRPKAANSPD
jgi:hypothetical protein